MWAIEKTIKSPLTSLWYTWTQLNYECAIEMYSCQLLQGMFSFCWNYIWTKKSKQVMVWVLFVQQLPPLVWRFLHDLFLTQITITFKAPKVSRVQSQTSLTGSTKIFCPHWLAPQPLRPSKTTLGWQRSWPSPTSPQTRGRQRSFSTDICSTKLQRGSTTKVSHKGVME